MKNLLTLTAVAISTALLLTDCKKDNSSYDSYFYQTQDSTSTQLTLYIDNDSKGNLPFLKNKPTCDSTALKQKALHLSLTAGKYTVTAKDKYGNTKSSGTITFSKTKSSGSTATGGQEVLQKDNCVIVRLFY